LPAIWREAAAESDDAVHQADRIAPIHDDCVADHEQAHSHKFCVTSSRASGPRVVRSTPILATPQTPVGAWLARDLARSGSRIG